MSCVNHEPIGSSPTEKVILQFKQKPLSNVHVANQRRTRNTTNANRYDLVLVNGGNTSSVATVGVGRSLDAVRVVATRPPRVDGAFPPTLLANSPPPVYIDGRYFDVDLTPAACAVALECDTVPATTLTRVCASSVVVEVNTTRLRAQFPATNAGLLCTLVVTNRDQATSQFASISTTSGSANLANPTLGDELRVARGGHASASLRVGATRFVYAIGGVHVDGDANVSVLTSTEFASLSKNGRPVGWQLSRSSPLPAGRAFGAAFSIGSGMYVCGGQSALAAVNTAGSASSALDSCVRAYALAQEEAPSFGDVTLSLVDNSSSTLTTGTYFYRLAAVFTTAHPHFEGAADDNGEERQR